MIALRNPDEEPFYMTPVYDVLLRGDSGMPIGLYHLGIATAEQLCRLHYSMGSIKTVKARLLTLSDHGYVQSDGIPSRSGRSPYYYTLGTEGMRYLHELGLDVSPSQRASKEVDKHYLFIQHALELNDVLIAAALLKRIEPTYSLDSFIHERVLKRKPYKVTWRGTPSGGEKFSLIPDAFLDFRHIQNDGSQRRMPVLLEHDRGTEEQQHFRRRIRAYIMMLKSEAQKDWFGVKAVTIAFTTFEGEKRREQLREWTRQELAATRESRAIGSAFCFTSLPKVPFDVYHLWLEACWYTPYEEDPPLSLLREG